MVLIIAGCLIPHYMYITLLLIITSNKLLLNPSIHITKNNIPVEASCMQI